MYYGRDNLGDMGIIPIAAILGGATSVLGIGSQIWGQKSVDAAQKDALKRANLLQKRADDAAKREAIRQSEEIARQEGLIEQQRIIDEANARRNISVIALYAVGGVAVLVSGAFILAAMRKETKGTKKLSRR